MPGVEKVAGEPKDAGFGRASTPVSVEPGAIHASTGAGLLKGSRRTFVLVLKLEPRLAPESKL